MTKLDWSKAKPRQPSLNIKDEDEYRANDRAAKWLNHVESQMVEKATGKRLSASDRKGWIQGKGNWGK